MYIKIKIKIIIKMHKQNPKPLKSLSKYGSCNNILKEFSGNLKSEQIASQEIIYHTPKDYNYIKKNTQLINKINANTRIDQKNGSTQFIQNPRKKVDYGHKRTISMQTLGDQNTQKQNEKDSKDLLKTLIHQHNTKSNQQLKKKTIENNLNCNQKRKDKHKFTKDNFFVNGKENSIQMKLRNQFPLKKKISFQSPQHMINIKYNKCQQIKWGSPISTKPLQNFQKKQIVITDSKKLENLTFKLENKNQHKYYSNFSNILPKNKYTFKPSQQYNSKKIIKNEINSKKHVHQNQKLNKTSKYFKIEDFQIGPLLGKGKYGIVNLVRHRETGFLCALKKIQKSVLRQENLEQQLIRELKIQSYLYHPNIINLYGFFADKAYVYVLLQLCSGGELYKVLKKKRKFDEEFTSNIIKQICEAVRYMHNNSIMHRDIKPQNIIIQNGVVKLCDFGWAVYFKDQLRKTLCGTPLYLSPQILKGDQYDYSTDIWTIGILTYQLLIGTIPFKISSENQLIKIIDDKVEFPMWLEISECAKDFILKVLKKDPRDRLTIQEMLIHPFLRSATENIIALL